MEHQRISHDDRNHDGRPQHDPEVNPSHKEERQGDQNNRAEKLRKLLRDKALDRLHVRSTALNDVTGAVLPVPGIGQVHDVCK